MNANVKGLKCSLMSMGEGIDMPNLIELPGIFGEVCPLIQWNTY